MTSLLRVVFFLMMSIALMPGVCGANSEPKDPNQNVGAFYCSDCEMAIGPVGPDTMVWIKTVVNTFVGNTWLTSAGDPKFFRNCNKSTCVRIDYVDVGNWVVSNIYANPGYLKYLAIGTATGGAISAPGGGGGSGSTGTSGSSNYWLETSNNCYEYFSDGISEGIQCNVN